MTTKDDPSLDRRNPLFALVVDADEMARARTVADLASYGLHIVAVGTLAEARGSLNAELALVIVSSKLAGAGAVPQLLRAARRVAPLVECVVIRDESEILPRVESACVLTRPVAPGAFEASVRVADETRCAMRAVTTILVGRVGLKEAQRVLRAGMSRAALARCSGSRRAAAALLGVDRRYVQKLCADRENKDDEVARFAYVARAVAV